jgi:transposase
MRGYVPDQLNFVSLIKVETLIAREHPLRVIKRMLDEVLHGMSGHFDEIYTADGAPSIPPETLLKAEVLQALYTVRSDRKLCDPLQTELLFRWFADLPLDRAVFDGSTFSKSQERLLAHRVDDLFFSEAVKLARRRGWGSDKHFSVDATLIEAWASMKSFKPKGSSGTGNPWTDFKGEKRSNDTHASTTAPETKLMSKEPGREARLSFAGHAAMKNRHGLCVLFEVHLAVGAPVPTVAVDQTIELRNRGFDPKSVGADNEYHTAEFVQELRTQHVVPHPACNGEANTMRLVCTAAYLASQKVRKRIEELFGRGKTIGCFRKSRYRGLARTHAAAQYVFAACNLVRMAKLWISDPPASTRA